MSKFDQMEMDPLDGGSIQIYRRQRVIIWTQKMLGSIAGPGIPWKIELLNLHDALLFNIHLLLAFGLVNFFPLI